jgi:hypothetical protein
MHKNTAPFSFRIPRYAKQKDAVRSYIRLALKLQVAYAHFYHAADDLNVAA